MEPAGSRVLVVLIASDGASAWLPEVLAGISAQTHRPIDIVALDNATSDGSGAILAEQLDPRRLQRIEHPISYARAVNHLLATARDRGFEADAYLFLHDDCALDPDALAVMLESLAIAEVGIVAPRLVDWDQPELLQDTGQTTDRFGRAVPRVERGELDQGQVEGTRAVLYVQSAAMLVDADLIDRIGAFDERFEALREDLDLCWRARICGRLTVVAGDARARHVQATLRGARPSPARGRLRELADRHLIASLLKNYGRTRAFVAVPATVVISLANAVLFMAAGRRRLAIQVFRALGWNIRHFPSTMNGRRRVQRLRTDPDRELSRLQHHGSRRLRAHLERIAERIVGGEIRGLDDADLDAPPPTLIKRLLAHPTAVAMMFALVLGVIATRGIFEAGPLAGADHGRFPAEPSLFFTEFASGWRGVTGASPASPGMLLLGIWSFITFASTWLAHRLLIALTVPLSAWAAARLAKRLGLGRSSQILAAASYGLGPVVLGAYAEGRIIEALIGIGAPIVVGRLLATTQGLPALRTGLGLAAVVTALVASLAPWMLVLVLLAGLSLSITRKALATLRASGVIVVASLIALLPWSTELFREGSPLFAGGTVTDPPLLDLVTLDPHGILRLSVSLGLAALTIFGATLVRPKYNLLAIDAGGMILMGLAATVLGRYLPLFGPRPGLPLILAAVGASILAALAADAAVVMLGRRAFGAPHLVALAAVVGLSFQAVGTVSFLADGAHPGIQAGRGLVPEFFKQEAERGDFRILWLDGTTKRPRFAVTGPAGLTMLDHLERPAGGAYGAAERAVEIITGRAGAAAGRILGTLGVRYVFVRPTASEDLAIAVGDQAELSLEQEIGGAKVFRNAIDIPVATAMRAPAWARVSARDLDAAQGVETNPSIGDPFVRVSPSAYRGTAPQGTRAILLGQPFHPGWRARIGDQTLEPRRSFGWATGFDLPAPSVEQTLPVELQWRGQVVHRLAIAGWLFALLILLAAWSRGASAGEDLR